MEQNKSWVRWLVAIWLLLAQAGGVILILVPFMILITLSIISLAGGAVAALWALSCIPPVLELIAIITGWIAFIRKKDVFAAIMGLVALLIGGGMYLAIEFYIKSIQ